MTIEEWIADKIIEIILALLSGGAVYYLFQINKNQKAFMVNSPNSQIIQAHGNVNINNLREGIKKETAFSEEIVEKEDNPNRKFGKKFKVIYYGITTKMQIEKSEGFEDKIKYKEGKVVDKKIKVVPEQDNIHKSFAINYVILED